MRTRLFTGNIETELKKNTLPVSRNISCIVGAFTHRYIHMYKHSDPEQLPDTTGPFEFMSGFEFKGKNLHTFGLSHKVLDGKSTNLHYQCSLVDSYLSLDIHN